MRRSKGLLGSRAINIYILYTTELTHFHCSGASSNVKQHKGYYGVKYCTEFV